MWVKNLVDAFRTLLIICKGTTGLDTWSHAYLVPQVSGSLVDWVWRPWTIGLPSLQKTKPEPSSHLIATICRACTRKRPRSHDPYLDIEVCRVQGMMIYEHACEISNHTFKVSTDTSGRLLCVDINEISGNFPMSSVLYGLDADCFNGSTSGKSLLVPQLSSWFI